jgi:hypothetical protein
MTWIIANSGEAYEGPTHRTGGVIYTGATRTADSRRLVEGTAPAPKPAPKRKAAPKKK